MSKVNKQLKVVANEQKVLMDISPNRISSDLAIFSASLGLLRPLNIFSLFLCILKGLLLLGRRDSNPNCLDQNQVYYHYTTPQLLLFDYSFDWVGNDCLITQLK